MNPNSPFLHLIARHKALALALARDFPEADEETLADTIEGGERPAGPTHGGAPLAPGGSELGRGATTAFGGDAGASGAPGGAC